MSLMRWLRFLIRNPGRCKELSEEIELHLEEKTAELKAEGMTEACARAEARRQFGNIGHKHEEAREIWMTRFLSELGQDIRYGLRAMSNNKGFSVLAVLSLALGIGANTAIYSFMEAILFRSLPVAEAESLVVMNWQSRSPQNANKDWAHVVHGVQGILWPGQKGAMVSGMFPYRAFETLQQEKAVFSSLFGYFDGQSSNVMIRGQAVAARKEYVSGEYFRGLIVSAAAGRMIDTQDDRIGAPPVAVVSYAASQNRFGSPSNAVGQTILVDKVPFTVIGVAPQEFFGVDPAASPDLYLPLHTNVLVEGNGVASMFHDQNFYWIEIMGRLQPGVSMEQAKLMLAPRFKRWVETTAQTDGERANLPSLIVNPGAAGLGSLRREYSKPLFVLLAMVGLILAITCANIANLLLARASARRREMAIRLSLGAGRFRVIRQLLTESVMLATLGGACGILFAIWGVQSLTYLFSKGQESFTLHAELNWKVLGATAALSVVCGVLFGLVPALQSTRPDVMTELKNGRAGGSRRRLQNVLVVAQIAMSFLILFASGLFVQTLNKLYSVQLGYARENILLFSVNARQAGYRDPEIGRFYNDLQKRFERVPEVISASLSHSSIISSGRSRWTIKGAMKIDGVTVEGARGMVAGPRYFTTMQIPLLAGREIDERDQSGSTPVAVISERMARTYFGNENPLGRRITLTEEKRDLEIVGVTANVRSGGLKEESPMTVFVAASQFTPDRVTYALRTSGDPMKIVNLVRDAVREADSSIPVTNVITQAAEVDRTINREITFAKLCSGFAVLALITACLGLYGTMSYSVSRQISEIGVRMALGAKRTAMIWMVLRRVLLLAAAGLAVSLPAALFGTRLIQSFLYGTQPNDPATLTMAGLVIIVSAILAGYLPAWRASRIDPLVALRHE